MATLTDVITRVSAYYGASDQEAPSRAVIMMASQSAIDAINDIRRYEPVRLVPEPDPDVPDAGSDGDVSPLADETGPEPPIDGTEPGGPENPDGGSSGDAGGEETPSVPSTPITPAIDVWDVLEDRYLSRAVRIAVYLCEKEGVDGVTSFSENGVSRAFEAADVPASMLRTVTPICRVFR